MAKLQSEPAPVRSIGAAESQSRPKSSPPLWISVSLVLVCLYAPVGWIAFTSRAPFLPSASEQIVFFVTLPGEWFAQNCGGRAYDYYWFAGIAVALLFLLGVTAGRRSWFALWYACLTMLGWSAFTAGWLWNDLWPK
jgi:hypothetical protein